MRQSILNGEKEREYIFVFYFIKFYKIIHPYEVINFSQSKTTHEISVSTNGNKFEIQGDLSKWAKKYLKGRPHVIQIAGSVKLEVENSSEEEEEDTLEKFWNRKGTKYFAFIC